jgi:DMSO reductase family type II enzyme iron-sulfur subunit
MKTKAQLKSSKRQLATVIDLNKCMSCQACVVACKNLWTQRDGTHHMRWMSVVTAPGRLYPRDFESMGGGFEADGTARPGRLPTLVDSGDNFQFNHQEVLYSGNAQAKKLEPRSAAHGGKPDWGYNWDEDQAKGEWPNPYFFYLPRKCNHCSEPACLEACSRNAIYKRDDGVVLINQDLCVGHRHCVEACPYKMVFFNPVAEKSEKCIECYPRLEAGVANACNRQCPGRTRTRSRRSMDRRRTTRPGSAKSIRRPSMSARAPCRCMAGVISQARRNRSLKNCSASTSISVSHSTMDYPNGRTGSSSNSSSCIT